MPISSLLLGAAVLVLVALFLGRPFILSSNDQRSRITARQELVNEKETIMAEIEILDFDHETGILPEQIYKQRRRQMVTQAAEILEKLDAYADIAEAKPTDTLDSEIEAAIARLRSPQRPTPAAVRAKPKVTTAVPQASSNLISTNGRVKFCSQCGQPIDEGDKFCAHCGHQIIQPQHA